VTVTAGGVTAANPLVSPDRSPNIDGTNIVARAMFGGGQYLDGCRFVKADLARYT